MMQKTSQISLTKSSSSKEFIQPHYSLEEYYILKCLKGKKRMTHEIQGLRMSRELCSKIIEVEENIKNINILNEIKYIQDDTKQVILFLIHYLYYNWINQCLKEDNLNESRNNNFMVKNIIAKLKNYQQSNILLPMLIEHLSEQRQRSFKAIDKIASNLSKNISYIKPKISDTVINMVNRWQSSYKKSSQICEIIKEGKQIVQAKIKQNKDTTDESRLLQMFDEFKKEMA